MTRVVVAFAVLLLTSCAHNKAPDGKPISPATAESVYAACVKSEGVSCSLNPELDVLTLKIDQTMPPEKTQESVSFVGEYYCRLSRLDGAHYNVVSLLYPDGSSVEKPCSLIGIVQPVD